MVKTIHCISITKCKYSDKRARNMKLASIFFTASEAIFEKTSNIAISEQESSLSEWVKIHFYTQRAQTTSAKPNMKFASIFFTASEAIFENIYK